MPTWPGSSAWWSPGADERRAGGATAPLPVARRCGAVRRRHGVRAGLRPALGGGGGAPLRAQAARADGAGGGDVLRPAGRPGSPGARAAHGCRPIGPVARSDHCPAGQSASSASPWPAPATRTRWGCGSRSWSERQPPCGELREPVLQSSANLSGGRDPRRLVEVDPAIRAGACVALDAGELPGVASTVVDLREFEAARALERRARRGGRARRAGARAIFDLPMSDDLTPDYFDRPVADVDPEIADVLASELDRQQRTLEMIASENFVPQAVLDCQGSVLTNKYAEGLPGKRYYGGCEQVDTAEQLAIDRACELFGSVLCQRPAALRRPGQHRRLPGPAAAGRPCAGPRPGPRRPSHPRHGQERLGPALRVHPLPRAPRQRACGHGGSRAPGP